MPADIELDVGPGEPLMAAATRLGYTWPTICGGQAACTACHVHLTDPEACDPPNALEQECLDTLVGTHLGTPEVRLACQLTVKSSTTVTKRGWKPRPNR
jgi:2Fe-2S ferredoxin